MKAAKQIKVESWQLKCGSEGEYLTSAGSRKDQMLEYCVSMTQKDN